MKNLGEAGAKVLGQVSSVWSGNSSVARESMLGPLGIWEGLRQVTGSHLGYRLPLAAAGGSREPSQEVVAGASVEQGGGEKRRDSG